MIGGLLDDFFTRAALAGLGLALVAGPLGCFVVWRRMAYFGEAVAHAALLGVALGLALALPVWVGALIVTLVVALTVSALTISGRNPPDAMLGVVAHAALAIGIVALSLTPGAGVDLERYLFGEILAVSRGDLAVIWAGAALVGLGMIWRWSALVDATISPDLARAEGGAPERERLALTVGVALVIALSMQVVGLLLVTALLILPAAAARPMARTPEAMALGAAAIGVAGVGLGLDGSWRFDTPAGPSIVAAVFLIFCATTALAPLMRRVSAWSPVMVKERK